MTPREGAVIRSTTSHAAAPDPLHALLEAWERRAQDLGPYAPPAATALRACARELEEALRSRDGAVLTLAQASRESGYSTRQLSRELTDGNIVNVGRPNAPKIRRSELPRKPGYLPQAASIPLLLSATQVARSVVNLDS